MQQWLEEKERHTTIGVRVTPAEKRAVEHLRKTLRMKSNGNVMRFGLQLVESVVSMADVEVPGEDEQVTVLRKFAAIVQEKDDDYLKSEAAADELEEFVAELLGIDGSGSRTTPAEEEVTAIEPSLFDKGL